MAKNVWSEPSGAGLGLRVATALALVYVVWGTTYFAIGVALKEISPLWLNASRFTVAGVLMLLWANWRAVSAKARWSSVSSKSTGVSPWKMLLFL